MTKTTPSSPPAEIGSGTRRRPTRQQAAVSARLSVSEDFLSAQDLHARMRADGEAVGLATVYRTLTSMAANGDLDVLRTDDGEAVYRMCSTGHHHHLVCRDCGRTVEIEGPTVERWAEQVAAEHGFSNVSHTLEIFGTCSEH